MSPPPRIPWPGGNDPGWCRSYCQCSGSRKRRVRSPDRVGCVPVAHPHVGEDAKRPAQPSNGENVLEDELTHRRRRVYVGWRWARRRGVRVVSFDGAHHPCPFHKFDPRWSRSSRPWTEFMSMLRAASRCSRDRTRPRIPRLVSHGHRVKRSELRQRDDCNNDGGRRPSEWLSRAPSRATAQVVARGHLSRAINESGRNDSNRRIHAGFA